MSCIGQNRQFLRSGSVDTSPLLLPAGSSVLQCFVFKSSIHSFGTPFCNCSKCTTPVFFIIHFQTIGRHILAWLSAGFCLQHNSPSTLVQSTFLPVQKQMYLAPNLRVEGLFSQLQYVCHLHQARIMADIRIPNNGRL